MRLRRALDWMRLAAALLLAAATASFGPAHAPRPVGAPAELLLLALPDGSLPELCGASHGAPADPAQDRHEGCLAACLALAAAPLPPPPVLSAQVATARRHPAPLAAGGGPRPVWAAAQARGPPSLG